MKIITIFIGWVGILTLAVVTFTIFQLLNGKLSIDIPTAGSLGDFMGGVLNPIIALLGVLLLAMTLNQNSEALELTRKELEKSSEQMTKSAEALQKQEDLMRLERQENLIFKVAEKIQTDFTRPFQDPLKPSTHLLWNSKEACIGKLFGEHLEPNDAHFILQTLDNKFGQDHLYLHTLWRLVRSEDNTVVKDQNLLLVPASIINTRYLIACSLIIFNRMVRAKSDFEHFEDNRVFDMLQIMIKISGAENLWRRVFEAYKNY